jgi:predicted dehydrogenase/threonine dehydrogenase-like Zn-dependent dehydrogenase
MRQLFLEKNTVAIKYVCEPLLDDDLVLVSVHYSFISSGTESATLSNASKNVFLTNIPQKITKVLESIAMNGIEGTKALIKGRLSGTVQALGYSCSGQVIAVGKKVKNFRAGDFVACAGAGYASHADYVCVPENLVVKVSDATYLKQASITTIGAIALQGIRRAQLQLGETVCVQGLGLLGQITVQLAKRAGCKVIGIDVVDERLVQAQKLGADAVFNATSPTLIKDCAFFTKHYGVDCTLITAASKSDSLVQQAMEITRKKGKVVLVGDVGLGLERAPFYQKEIDFLISCSYGPGRYDSSYEQQGHDYPFAYVRWTENRNMQSFLELIEKNQIDINSLVSQALPVEQAADAYEQLKNRQGLGIILAYVPKDDLVIVAAQEDVQKKSEQKNLAFKPATAAQLRVGFVGAGGFAKVKLMPIVAKIKNAKIHAIVDSDVSNSINVSRLYGCATSLVNDTELFDKDLVDVVVIASPHKYHCDQILTALTHGKAVFVEKPMVTDFAQLEKLNNFLTLNPSMPLCVDYNRSFAPFMRKIKAAITQRNSPLMVHYRMNAGYIPKEHWVQTDVGAGRIIGEACHIFDLFCFLTDAKPVSVSVESLNPNSENILSSDNISAQISFSDGSVCTLLYTSLGHAGLGKERMELYFDSKAIVMDDYLTLQGHGLPASFNEKVTTADKGHEYLLNQFFGSLKDSSMLMPITRERLATVAELTLIIDQLACKGGGVQEL